MLRRTLYTVMLWLTLLGTPGRVCAKAPEAPVSKEYRIKAAYLYNFLKTIGWPENLPPAMQDQVTLGILGPNPFGDSLSELETKTTQGKPIVVRYFDSFAALREKLNTREDATEVNSRLKEIGTCHVLFVSRSETVHLSAILRLIEQRPVLTVGEELDFLETGGVVNFVPGGKKGGFEIDLSHAKVLGLTVSSKLLRLAERVIEEGKQP